MYDLLYIYVHICVYCTDNDTMGAHIYANPSLLLIEQVNPNINPIAHYVFITIIYINFATYTKHSSFVLNM